MDAVKTKKDNSKMIMMLLKGRTFIVLIVLLIFFSIANSNFLSFSTLTMLAKHVALYGIIWHFSHWHDFRYYYQRH